MKIDARKKDYERSLSFPGVFLAFLRAIEPRDARARKKGKRKVRKNFFFPLPHSLLVSFSNLHNINWFRASGRLRVKKANFAGIFWANFTEK